MKKQYYWIVISKDRKHIAYKCNSELDAQIALKSMVSPWLYKILRKEVQGDD